MFSGTGFAEGMDNPFVTSFVSRNGFVDTGRIPVDVVDAMRLRKGLFDMRGDAPRSTDAIFSTQPMLRLKNPSRVRHSTRSRARGREPGCIGYVHTRRRGLRKRHVCCEFYPSEQGRRYRTCTAYRLKQQSRRAGFACSGSCYSNWL